MSIFTDAKRIIIANPSHYFPDGETRNGEWWFRRRADDHTPSCHILPGGACKDFGDSSFRGSCLDVYAESKGMSAEEAAKEIIGEGGVVPAEKPKTEKYKKPKPVIPIPPEALRKLNGTTKSDYAKKKHGKPAGGWKYHTAEGEVCFCVVRYERPGKKEIIPYYYGEDSKFHEGQALKAGRPLYQLHELIKSDLPVLVVEGERCADIKVPGYILATWAGGSSAVSKTDWVPLAKRDVLIWPDADDAGIKAAAAIRNRLPHAKILQIKDKPSGWDIADCTDPAKFIAECPVFAEPGKDSGLPFICLGYDSEKYWFLNRRQRLPYTIERGHFTISKLGELAPLAWWAVNSMTSDSGSIKVACAQDYIIGESDKSGMFLVDSLRGAGVWLDNGKPVINDGQRIIRMDGSSASFEQCGGDAHYIASEARFGDMKGAASTDDEGTLLGHLFKAQQFQTRAEAIAVLGWALIAPFGGLLKWRPHIWITGRKGTGKTFVLESIIRNLCGPFAHLGSGKDTEAGIRRTLNMDARPVILDEMEPKSRSARENVSKILDLARNSSGDGSGRTTMAAAGGSGTVHYLTRSCFCFASVNTPDEGAAIGSRIIKCELKPVQDEKEKHSRSSDIYTSVMLDPGRFRRRIFRALPRILEDIEYLRKNLVGLIGDQRLVDLYAPVIVAAWSIQSTEQIDSKIGRDWTYKILDEIMLKSEELVEDEDRVVEHLLASPIRLDDTHTRTIAELLRYASNQDPSFIYAAESLSRIGIKLTDYQNGDGNSHQVIAIDAHSDHLQKVLSDTIYQHGYDAQLRRHKYCLNKEKMIQLRMAIGRPRCYLLDWEKFQERYMGGDG